MNNTNDEVSEEPGGVLLRPGGTVWE